LEKVVLQWVATYGYLAIFTLLAFGIAGLPVPDEFLLTGCGFLVYKGDLRLLPTVSSAIAGSMLGITFGYTIGRTIGWKFLHSRAGRWLHVTDKDIQRVHDWFNRIGHWALMIGYFIPGVRHFTAIVAGTSKLETRSFALFAYSGAILWVCTFVFIGYHFGENWPQIFEQVEKHLTLASVVAGAVALAYLLFRYFRQKKA
jgi:membrane protein DedA with SNARE-associated domain